MIDYIKLKILNPPINSLLYNDLLSFQTQINEYAEVIKHTAKYKSLQFILYENTTTYPQGVLYISGSLHKYFNNGKHNYNQFVKNDFIKVVNNLAEKFNLNPKNSIITSMEVGLNITPPIPTKDMLNFCISHRKKPFKSIYTKDEGYYIQAKKQRHIIKIYDKKTHYKKFNQPNEIMRLELKYLKMTALHNQGIYNLQDLLNFDFEIFRKELLKVWNEILIYEPKIWDNTPYEYKYSNTKYWQQLKPDSYKYHLKKVKRQNKIGLQNKIYKKIKETQI